MSVASSPFQAQSKVNRVCAFECTGVWSFASFQLLPPSVDTSTLLITPPPDQARPVIWTYPLPGMLNPAEGRVITDFGPISKWYQRDLPPRSSRGMEWFMDSFQAWYGWSVTLMCLRYFTLKGASQPGTNSRIG